MNLLMALTRLAARHARRRVARARPNAAIAILFPLTAVLPPVPAIIMLAGIYYGAMYGGSTTAILAQHPRRGRLRADLPGRLSDGAAGARRRRAWDCRPSARSSPARSA